MDWSFIIQHLISGYLPVIAALMLYFIFLHVSGKKQTAAHITLSFVFCFYLIGILTMTGVCFLGSFSPRIVYIPFADMIRGPVDTGLNVLLFFPMGVFLPMLYGKFDSVRKIAATGFLVSLSVETAQMFGSGTTDINDLITNTIGACLGFCVCRLLERRIPGRWIRQIRVDSLQCYTESLLFWAGSLLVMLTVQVRVFETFFSAAQTAGELHSWN